MDAQINNKTMHVANTRITLLLDLCSWVMPVPLHNGEDERNEFVVNILVHSNCHLIKEPQK